MYVESLKEGQSREGMLRSLAQAARLLWGPSVDVAAAPWSALRYPDVLRLRSTLATRYRPATANKCLAGVKGVSLHEWRLGRMRTEDYQRIRDVRGLPPEQTLAGRALAPEEVAALFSVTERDPALKGRRDSAALALLYGGALRHSEALDLEVFDWHSPALTLRHTKSGPTQHVYLFGHWAELLEAWISEAELVRGPLLCPIEFGHPVERHMQRGALSRIVLQRATEARVGYLTPHDLRRSCITHLLSRFDPLIVAKFARHARVTTTQRYDFRGESALRDAALWLAGEEKEEPQS